MRSTLELPKASLGLRPSNRGRVESVNGRTAERPNEFGLKTEVKVLRKIWERWKVIAEKIGTFQAKIILGLLYFLFVGPVALARRFVADPLGLRPRARSTYWNPRPPAPATLEAARRQ